MKAVGIAVLRTLAWLVGAGALLALLVFALERLVPDHVLTDIAPWQVYAMVIPATGFPLLYLTFYKWYASALGRALMTHAVGLLLLIDFSAYFAMTKGQYGWASEVQNLIFLIVLIGLWYEFIVFLKIRLGKDEKMPSRGKRERREDSKPA